MVQRERDVLLCTFCENQPSSKRNNDSKSKSEYFILGNRSMIRFALQMKIYRQNDGGQTHYQFFLESANKVVCGVYLQFNVTN